MAKVFGCNGIRCMLVDAMYSLLYELSREEYAVF